MAEQTESYTKVTLLPAELLLRVYNALPSLFDAANLRATCHLLRSVWTLHRTVIVDALVIKKIDCYPYARQLLAKGRRGIPVEKKELADNELAMLVRNAATIDGFIGHIERNLVPELKVSGIPQAKRNTIYAGRSTHPPTLTPTERLRVIRASYQMWTILQNDDDTVRKEVFRLRPRQLWYFAELTDWARVAEFPSRNTWQTFQILKASKAALSRMYKELWDCERPFFWNEVPDEEGWGLYVIWDHWQDGLRNLICRRPVGNLEWDREGEPRVEFWDSEEGDELFVEGIYRDV
ncbi:hypothetical protein CC78DRAFT_594126 [Lojkania enalia]|uniref:F-box domain-containing protein n=1 Tax=Lojkania enalia TaxID=147567 RepID=A0A9P4K371_9PLEO|nr:hypothetical protein CC78DRAFT_594126 [Didymosphaeria enalia]